MSRVVRAVKGKIVFDEFDGTALAPMWEPFPLDLSRYNVMTPDVIELIAGGTDFMLLWNEKKEYVFDVINNYFPMGVTDFSGIVVFRDEQENVEFLEFWDTDKPVTSVYKYMRVKKEDMIYTFYAKNNDVDEWELIHSTNIVGKGRIGLIIKGESQDNYQVDAVRIYQSNNIRLINIPPEYTVYLYDDTDAILGSYIVQDQQQGARFIVDKIPPYSCRFKIYNEENTLVHTTSLFMDMCGGDIYYYGAMPEVYYEGITLFNDNEFFLGYVTNDKLDFELEVVNPWLHDFFNLQMSALKYNDGSGYKYVEFSLDEVDYEKTVALGDLLVGERKTVYVRIQKAIEEMAYEIGPLKFQIELTFE